MANDQRTNEPPPHSTFGAKVSKPQEPLTTPGTEKLHRFWDTQPVPRVTDNIDGIKVLLNFSNDLHQSGPLVNEPPEVPEQPYKLPPNFAWDNIDVANENQIKELVDLLDGHYVEDDDACFRFQYSADCLRWALTPPGYHANWHIGIRANTKLVAFISGVPATIMVLDKAVKMAEINFLCIHTKLRSRRLAPVLIREVTRRVNLEKIWQAVYTAGVILPKPITTATYYHRSLNIKKLVDVGFTYLPATQTMEIAERLSALPQSFTLPHVRVMQPEDSSGVLQLLKKDFQCRRAQLYPEMTIEDVEHWLLPRKNIMNSYVKTDDKGNITDFFSFYELPSTVIRYNTNYETVKAAYNYYTVAGSVTHEELMKQALIAAKNQSYDVFNALDIGLNKGTFINLKFGVGDGSLKYYLFNWKFPSVRKPRNIAPHHFLRSIPVK